MSRNIWKVYCKSQWSSWALVFSVLPIPLKLFRKREDKCLDRWVTPVLNDPTFNTLSLARIGIFRMEGR